MAALGAPGRRAASPATNEQGGVAQGRQYLTFQIAGEMFAMAISAIKEIIEYRDPTGVPMMPAYMRGVINLRGRVVPVIDLAARFGRGRSQTTRRSCVVILELHHDDGEHDIGILVDAVSAVIEISDADIEPPPSFGAGLRPEFISGMGRIGERFAIILDIDKVLSLDEIATLDGLEAVEAPAQ